MSRLSALQLAFQQYMLQGAPEIRDRVANAHADQRLRIYHEAYRLRLIGALASDYQALRAYMGVGVFNDMCRVYIEQRPSVLRNVRWYGANLPQNLHDTLPFSQDPVLSEIASFEWSLTVAFDAADESTVSFEDLAAISTHDWPALTLRLHPSVHLLDLRTNAPAIRKACDANQPLPSVVLAERPTSWLVWRSDYTPCYRSLSAAEAWALRAMRGRAEFSTLCEGLCEWTRPDEAAACAASFLRQWVDDGLIVEAVHAR